MSTTTAAPPDLAAFCARYDMKDDMNDVARRLGIAPPAGSLGEKAMVGLQRLRARVLRRSV